MSLPVMVRISNKLLISLDYLVFGKQPGIIGIIKNTKKHVFVIKLGTSTKKLILSLKDVSATELKFILKIIVTILPYISIK